MESGLWTHTDKMRITAQTLRAPGLWEGAGFVLPFLPESSSPIFQNHNLLRAYYVAGMLRELYTSENAAKPMLLLLSSYFWVRKPGHREVL